MTAPALLVTSDGVLLEELVRLAAAAGAALEVAHDPGEALPRWSAAPVVLVGADQADRLADVGPGRRPEVHVVATGAAPETLFRPALELGARAVVELPAAADWLVALLTDAGDGAGRPAWTVAVVGGCGGAGATTFATTLARAAADQGTALLLDLDPWGPGLDQVVGRPETRGVRWDALAGSSGRLGSRSLRSALPSYDDLAWLTFGPGDRSEPAAPAVREVLSAAQRGSDVVVVDLPRALPATAVEVAARCDLVLVLAEARVPAVAATGKVAARLRGAAGDLRLVVRTSGRALDPAGMAEVLGLPLLADYPSRRRVAEHLDLGVGPVHGRRCPMLRAARAVLAGSRSGR